MKLPITLIVLTLNEEANLDYCLKSSAPRVSQIIIVDSGSTDQTLEIAKRYGAKVYTHPFKNQADQFNWALDNTDIESEWVLRLDADEVVSEELWNEITTTLSKVPAEVNGFFLKRRMYFRGQWIKHGGYYPTWLLRLFRKGKARSEERAMDEHLILSEGRTLNLLNDFKDENHRDLKWWIAKHRAYAKREAEAMFEARLSANADKGRVESDIFGSQPERRRWLKENFYLRLPIFLRPFFYFFYRYFLRLGFLDGIQGLVFHFMQGLWYRLLVDREYFAMRPTYVYPKFSTLGAFGFRTGGPGLGNLFFSYARALLIAKERGFQMINPSWATFKLGTFLRFERDKRLYLRVFNKRGIRGIKKTFLLLTRPKAEENDTLTARPGSIVLTSGLGNFFRDIAHERAYIAKRFSDLLRPQDKEAIRARGPYGIGVHVRMGDFQAHQRVPLSWYVAMITKIRSATGKDLPVALASDGTDEELAELLGIPGVKRLNMNAVADLFALSSCKIILASNSTFSAWAAFLGHVPILWARRGPELEAIFNDDTPDEVVEEKDNLPENIVDRLK